MAGDKTVSGMMDLSIGYTPVDLNSLSLINKQEEYYDHSGCYPMKSWRWSGFKPYILSLKN